MNCGLGSMTAAVDDYGKDRDVGGIDSGYPGRLRQRLGSPLLQFLPALEPYRRALVVIKPTGYLRLFIPLRPFRRNLLLFYISFVLSHNIYLFLNLIRKI